MHFQDFDHHLYFHYFITGFLTAIVNGKVGLEFRVRKIFVRNFGQHNIKVTMLNNYEGEKTLHVSCFYIDDDNRKYTIGLTPLEYDQLNNFVDVSEYRLKQEAYRIEKDNLYQSDFAAKIEK